ncbi:MAG: hypothetical protein ACI86X_002650, partial [Moritella sp.]
MAVEAKMTALSHSFISEYYLYISEYYLYIS